MSALGSKMRPLNLDALTIADIEAVRTFLRGDSVVDWRRLRLRSPEEVKRFLRVNCYDLDSSRDARRLEYLYGQAVSFLETHFAYHFPRELRHPKSMVEPFLMASSVGEYQNLACVLLKVLHILNHVEARELRFRLPVSEESLIGLAEAKVNSAIQELIGSGAAIVSYQASRKSRDSIVTKLLAKRSAHASQIFDRLRFRLVVESKPDILAVLVYLKDNLLPYNYVVPGESRNDIFKVQSVLETVPGLRPLLPQLSFDLRLDEAAEQPVNEFSGRDFKVLNFVVDMPVRVDDFVERLHESSVKALGFLVFVLLEFQIFDKATFERIQVGESSHDRYKERQKWQVVRRLVYGGPPPPSRKS